MSTGAGESGKSTVLKQMRLIYTQGFAPQERKQWRVTIFNNLINAYQCIQAAMEEHEVEFALQDSDVRASFPHVSCCKLMLVRNTCSRSVQNQRLVPKTRCLWTTCQPSSIFGVIAASKTQSRRATNTHCTTTSSSMSLL